MEGLLVIYLVGEMKGRKIGWLADLLLVAFWTNLKYVINFQQVEWLTFSNLELPTNLEILTGANIIFKKVFSGGNKKNVLYGIRIRTNELLWVSWEIDNLALPIQIIFFSVFNVVSTNDLPVLAAKAVWVVGTLRITYELVQNWGITNFCIFYCENCYISL